MEGIGRKFLPGQGGEAEETCDEDLGVKYTRCRVRREREKC